MLFSGPMTSGMSREEESAKQGENWVRGSWERITWECHGGVPKEELISRGQEQARVTDLIV